MKSYIRLALLAGFLALNGCLIIQQHHEAEKKEAPAPAGRAAAPPQVGLLAATRYFAPTGTGTGTACTAGSPCTIATALSQAACGDTLVALNGTYSVAADMLYIGPSQTSATSCAGNRVTLQAANDGGALFDG